MTYKPEVMMKPTKVTFKVSGESDLLIISVRAVNKHRAPSETESVQGDDASHPEGIASSGKANELRVEVECYDENEAEKLREATGIGELEIVWENVKGLKTNTETIDNVSCWGDGGSRTYSGEAEVFVVEGYFFSTDGTTEPSSVVKDT